MVNGQASTRGVGRVGKHMRRTRIVVVGAVVALLAALVPAIALQPGVAGAIGSTPVTFVPHSGPAVGGNTVTISGSGLAGATVVSFGSQNASFTQPAPDTILATAPGGLDGPVTLAVGTPGGPVTAGTYYYGPLSTYSAYKSISVVPPYVSASSPYDITTGPHGNLWFAYSNVYCNNCIGELTPGGLLTVHQDPTINDPRGVALGPDGNLWFTNYGNSTIGRIDTNGVVTNYSGGGILHPEDIVAGPDGAMWFTNNGTSYFAPSTGSIGRITTDGTSISKYTDASISGPWQITAGPAGNNDLWFTNRGDDTIGRIQTNGTVAAYTDGSTVKSPFDIAAIDGSGSGSGSVVFTNSGTGTLGSVSEGPGNPVTNFTASGVHANAGIVVSPDHSLWFANGIQSIGRVAPGSSTPFGAVTTFTDPLISGATNQPFAITNGPDGALWFTEPYDALVGRLDPNAVDVQPHVTAVSPAIGVSAGGNAVTVTGSGFVRGNTIVNFGSTPGTGVVVNSSTSLTVTAPAGTTGTVDITVSTAGGSSDVSPADQYTYGFAITTPPGSLGTVVIGTPFVAPALTADGGVAPYKFKVTSTAKLPKGLKLNAKTGVITGTVKPGKTAPAPGIYSFTVTATDSTKKTKQTTSSNFSLTLSN